LELKDYLEVIKRRKWWIITAVVVITLAALVYSSFFQEKLYQAVSRVVIKEKPLESNIFTELNLEELSTQPERSMQTQVELLKSKTLALRVINALQLELTPEELMKKISVEPLGKTNIIEVKVVDGRAILAKDIANQCVLEYQSWRRDENVKEVSTAIGEVWDVLQQTKDEAITFSRDIEKRYAGKSIPEELKVQQEIAFNSYVDLQRTYRQLTIAEDLMSGGLEVLMDEDPPAHPIQPRPVRNSVLAFFVGSLLGFGLAFLVDYLDDTIKTREDVEKLFELPVLGEIPRSPEARERSIAMVASPKATIAEAFRALRTNIQFINFEQDLKLVMFTSPGPGEGKTSMVVNLGMALAEAGHRVLVISADMRKPKLHEYFHFDNKKGLSTVLIGRATMEECLRTSTLPHLKVLTSGPIPPNPSELLGSRRMSEVMEEGRAMADFVLLDMPPVLAATDAQVLGPRVDGAVLVVSKGTSRREEARKTKELLQQVKTRMLGIVLNNVEEVASYEYYYYYHGSDRMRRGRRK
jgi:non-specific protein-tyrosine kinase